MKDGVWRRDCVCVRVIILNKHVCVWNVWIDAKLLFCLIYKSISRGTGADLPSQSTKAMAFRWMSGLINHLYLLFTIHGMRPSPEPLHRHTLLHVRLPQSELWMVSFLVWLYACTLQSNIQIWGHGFILETFGKGFGIASLLTLFYMIIPMSTSSRIPPIHNPSCSCMIGIHYTLWIIIMIHFLSSVCRRWCMLLAMSKNLL